MIGPNQQTTVLDLISLRLDPQHCRNHLKNWWTINPPWRPLCPPSVLRYSWRTTEWTECRIDVLLSQQDRRRGNQTGLCGGGIQTREVYCVQTSTSTPPNLGSLRSKEGEFLLYLIFCIFSPPPAFVHFIYSAGLLISVLRTCERIKGEGKTKISDRDVSNQRFYFLLRLTKTLFVILWLKSLGTTNQNIQF